MSFEREISGTLAVPELPLEAIEPLTRLCFGEQSVFDRPVDAIMIFGTGSLESQHACAQHFRDIRNRTQAHTVYVTGGKMNPVDSCAESRAIHSLLWADKYPDVSFKLEASSHNTIENVLSTIGLGIRQHKSLAFIAAWPHCGRCQLTLREYMPHMELLQRGYVRTFPGASGCITPDFWPHDEVYRLRVWREFLHIEQYGNEGHIAYPEAVQSLVKRIRELVPSAP